MDRVVATYRVKIVTFSALSLLLAALVDVVFYLLGGLVDVFLAMLWGGLRMYAPTISVLAVAGRKTVRDSLLLGRRALILYFASPLIAFSAVFLYHVIITLMGLLTLEPLQAMAPPYITMEALPVLTIISGYISSITINSLFALGEEIGWRGYLQTELEAAGYSTLRASILVGLIWGLWHASAILLLGQNYPENRPLGVVLFAAFTTILSYPFAALRRFSSSVIPAASLHGAINAIWGLTILTTRAPRELGGLGLLGIATWLIISSMTYYVSGLRKTPTS
ncbi:MAG: CPBP family intramembrane glutamic endopeptidase [Nitrososphaerota archaeon]